MQLENLLVFIPVMALFIIVPGPDFAIVSKLTIEAGRGSGQAAAIGVALGICLHTLLAILGISALIAGSPLLFGLLKYAGAIYLFQVGLRELFAVRHMSAPETAGPGAAADPAARLQKQAGLARAFRSGFLTNALNPKAVLCFMVLFPQFLDPGASLTGQFVEMGLISALLGCAWFVALARLLDRARAFFASPVCRIWLARITGAVFMFFALRLALQEGTATAAI